MFTLKRWLLAGDHVEPDDHKKASVKCPPDFIQVNDKSCYCPLSKRLDWSKAAEACRYLHSHAFPVSINCVDEQRAVHAVSALLGQFTAS